MKLKPGRDITVEHKSSNRGAANSEISTVLFLLSSATKLLASQLHNFITKNMKC